MEDRSQNCFQFIRTFLYLYKWENESVNLKTPVHIKREFCSKYWEETKIQETLSSESSSVWFFHPYNCDPQTDLLDV